jgi:hypothetical protein
VRCRQHAGALGLPATRIDELSAHLEAAIGSSDPKRIAETVAAVDREITTIERDLIKEAGARAGMASQAAELRRRYDELPAKVAALTELAQRCQAKIASAPRLGIPSLAALGEPPAPIAGNDPQAREAGRHALAQYAKEIGRFAAAVAEAEARFAARWRSGGSPRAARRTVTAAPKALAEARRSKAATRPPTTCCGRRRATSRRRVRSSGSISRRGRRRRASRPRLPRAPSGEGRHVELAPVPEAMPRSGLHGRDRRRVLQRVRYAWQRASRDGRDGKRIDRCDCVQSYGWDLQQALEHADWLGAQQ